MARTAQLAYMIEKISNHFKEESLNEKYYAYIRGLNGISGINLDIVKNNALTEIRDSLMAYGKNQERMRKRMSFWENIPLSKRDKLILDERLGQYYSILKAKRL